MIIDDKNSKKRVKNDLRTLPKKCRKLHQNFGFWNLCVLVVKIKIQKSKN